jgi:spore germination cell wall hydrolase CwlJ-like protein
MMTAFAFDPAHLWRRYPREIAGLAGLGLIGAAAIAGTAGSILQPSGADAAVLPPPPAMEYRPVAPQDALKINSTIPVVGPAGAAQPFRFAGASTAAQARALECLTSAIYYEAGQEPLDGQRAVAQVVLNRVRHPAFPASVCGVVYQGSTRQTGCQFTFTCDGSLGRAPMASTWERARKVAAAALAGSVYAGVGNATHYHADYVVPYWAASQAKTAVIGAHLFYRWSGGWGQQTAFTQTYSGRESDPRALRLATLNITRVPRAPDGTVLTAGAGPVVTRIAGTAVQIEPDGKRMRVLFTPQAREAVEKVVHKPYVERAAASDNLRWTLGDNAPATAEAAFGTKPGAATEVATKAN